MAATIEAIPHFGQIPTAGIRLNQATEAFQVAEEGHARGKVVLEMKQG